VAGWEWPDELDALLAAPEHHRLLLENESVRVLKTVIAVGEMTAVHTHRWPNVQYVVSVADFVRRDGDGNVILDTRASGAPTPSTALWSEPIPPHSLENVGDSELCVIMVELKD
jgi:hypothetical protein